MHKSVVAGRPRPVGLGLSHGRQLPEKQCVYVDVGLGPRDNIGLGIGLGLSRTVCSKILVDIIKYLVFQKQQIPYPYLHLKNIATQFAMPSEDKSLQKMSTLHKKRYLPAVHAYTALEEIFQSLECELKQSSGDGTQEVAVLMGATPMSPQDVYHIRLPPLSSALCDITASYHQSLMLLMRSFTASSHLNDIFNKPMAPTNTYILLKKMPGTASESFLIKDRYSVPMRGNQVFINLHHPTSEQKEPTCNVITPAFENIDLCNRSGADTDCVEYATANSKTSDSCVVMSSKCNFVIFGDDCAIRKSNSPSNSRKSEMMDTAEASDRKSVGEGTSKPRSTSDKVASFQWYQSCTILKGFK